MTLLDDTAEWFKRRQTKIRRWCEDDEGRYAFRVRVEGEEFYVAALSQSHRGGEISVMRKLIRRAQDRDAMLLVRVRDEKLVYDPDSFESRDREGVITDERKRRGERWLHVPKDWGVPFRDYVEGRQTPDTRYDDLRDYA